MGEGRELPPDSVNRPGDEAFSPPLKDPGQGTGDPLVALREGDPGPFEAFVTSETGRFLGFFGRLGASRSEADDLVQETFLKLFRLASQHAAGADYAAQGRFEAYAFRVARNVWIDRSRRRSVQPGHSAQDATELAISTDARREAAAPTTPALIWRPKRSRLGSGRPSGRCRRLTASFSNWGSFRSCRTARSPTLWRFPWGP